MTSSLDTRSSGSFFTAAPRLWAVLFFVSLVLVLLEPGHVPLFEPDEGRYSEIPREMLLTGDFITPRLNGVLYFEKPPLFYWLVAGSFKVFGENEFAARLPSKLSVIGMALAAYFFARKRYGPRIGLLSGLIVSTSILGFVLARITIIDPLVSLALSVAGFAFISFAEAETAGNRKRAQVMLYGLHVACAAAVMAKGLIGIVLPGAAIVIWIAVTGHYRLIPRLFSPGPLITFLVLVVPWHVLLAQREPSFLNFYFVNEHFNRFLKPEHRRDGTPFYFVFVLLAGFLPWTAFFGRLRESWPGFRLGSWREKPIEGFLWVFFLFLLFFFSISKSKLIPYILPVWPAFAVLLALGIERAGRLSATFRADRWLLGMLYCALTVAAVVYGFGLGFAVKFGILAPALLMLGALGGGALWNLFASSKSERSHDNVLSAAGPWLVFLVAALWSFPGIAQRITSWPIAAKLNEVSKPGDVLVQYGHYVQAIPFYTKRLTPIYRLGWHELNFGQNLTKDKWLFPAEAEFEALWKGPRRVLVVFHRGSLGVLGRPELGGPAPVFLAQTENRKHYLVSNRP